MTLVYKRRMASFHGLKVIKGESAAGISWAPPTPTSKWMAPLEYPFVCWFSKKKNYIDFPSALEQFGRIETMEELWQSFSRTPKPSEVTDTNTFLFMEGVVPLWEENRSGGHWQFVLKKGLVSKYWADLSSALVGHRFPVESGEVCGIGLSVRNEKDWITVWNRSGSNEEVIAIIRQSIKEILKLSFDTVFTYRKHGEYTQWDSVRGQAKILRGLGRRC